MGHVGIATLPVSTLCPIAVGDRYTGLNNYNAIFEFRVLGQASPGIS
jgi:hypothetical protein